MKLSELLKSEKYIYADNIENIDILSISTDAEKIDENTLFIFIKST